MNNRSFKTALALTLSTVLFSVFLVIHTHADWIIPSRAIDENFNVSEVIQEALTDETVSEEFSRIDRRYTAGECRVDKERYILEYSVSTSFWADLKSPDYNSLVEQTGGQPNIYVPVWADVVNDRSELSERAVGHFKISYDPLQEKYVTTLTLVNSTDSAFLSGDNVHFYEKTRSFAAKHYPYAEQVLLIRYPDALNDFMEKTALIVSDGEPVIFDCSNSLHLDDSRAQKDYYSVAEYRELRLQLEKELYSNTSAIHNIEAGGRTNTIGNNNAGIRTVLTVCITAVVAVFAAGTVFFVVRAKKKKSL